MTTAFATISMYQSLNDRSEMKDHEYNREMHDRLSPNLKDHLLLFYMGIFAHSNTKLCAKMYLMSLALQHET